jgi:3-mercaptopyruvate sulfurtransferase SseA
MLTATEDCFEGSATLCAVNVALVGEGRIPGAVYLPLRSTLPHAEGHAAPLTLQRTAVSGCPALVSVA